jgi:hypothetical protein
MVSISKELQYSTSLLKGLVNLKLCTINSISLGSICIFINAILRVKSYCYLYFFFFFLTNIDCIFFSVIESHPDSVHEDLRLTRPFSRLVEYCNSLDMETMTQKASVIN